MATKIEIIGLVGSSVSVALYFPVAAGDQLPGAVDANRVPAGTRLSVVEQQDLKDGKLIEETHSIPVSGTKAGMRARIEQLWAARADASRAEYKRRYTQADLIGKAWDGTNWS